MSGNIKAAAARLDQQTGRPAKASFMVTFVDPAAEGRSIRLGDLTARGKGDKPIWTHEDGTDSKSRLVPCGDCTVL
jgi:hypothetical protein